MKLDNVLRFEKVSEEASLPRRANDFDAGLDVKAIKIKKVSAVGYVDLFPVRTAEEANKHVEATGELEVQFGTSVILHTGLKVEVPKGYMLEVKNRSSVASRGLIVGACVIDSGYTGEIFVNLLNPFSGYGSVSIPIDQAVAQLVLVPVSCRYPVEVAEVRGEGERGEGGFGSTNNK